MNELFKYPNVIGHGLTHGEKKAVLVSRKLPLAALAEQDLAQRFFAARTKKIATLSALLTGGFMILFALVPIYFGMQAKLLGL